MMKKRKVQALLLLAVFLLTGLLGGCDFYAVMPISGTGNTDSNSSDNAIIEISEDGIYDTKDEVALYINTYGHLPNNYITKAEAKKAGWPGENLEKYCPGKCIGGTHFGNYEGLLPEADGREYTECDINTLGKDSRGAERIVFSNDGLIYYTGDHYQSF